MDPELGINVVDLGLIYGITVDAQSHAVIDMTLTSAACPLTDVIEDQTAQALEGLVPRTGSTGSGCRRGARTRSPTTAASSCGRSASTSDPPAVSRLTGSDPAHPDSRCGPLPGPHRLSSCGARGRETGARHHRDCARVMFHLLRTA